MTEAWKFGVLTPTGSEEAHRYQDRWAREHTAGPDRLVISAEGRYADLLLSLASRLPEPFGLLYVLIVSRCGRQSGRYQAPAPLSLAEVGPFITEFAPFLEGDGRHHVWLTSIPSNATLVYDNHNLIYAYGDLASFQNVLRTRGFHEGDVGIPAPHVHRYNPDFDAAEELIMKRWDWRHFPLQDSDDP